MLNLRDILIAILTAKHSGAFIYVYIMLSVGIWISIAYFGYRLYSRDNNFFGENVKVPSSFSSMISRLSEANFLKPIKGMDYYKELLKKLDILAIDFHGIRVEPDVIIFGSVLVTLLFTAFVNIIFGWNILLTLSGGIITMLVLSVHLVDNAYLEKRRKFERKIPEVGLIIKQLVALRKPLPVIIQSLAATKEPSISGEFNEVYTIYITTNDVPRALSRINERYPGSILKAVVYLLQIYYEHEKDISEEIENLVKEVEAVERIKKKIEVEFARQDKTLMSLVLVSVSFIVIFIAMNESFKDFYSSRQGISIALIVTLYIAAGIGLISYLKNLIVKERKIKRITTGKR